AVDVLQLAVERLDAIGHLAHLRHLGGRVLALAPGLADRFGGAVAQRLEVFGLLDEAAAVGVAGEDLPDELRAALFRERALDLFRVVADQPEIEHARYCVSAGACSASTRAIDPTRSSASRSIIRTPIVLRPCERTPSACMRIILPFVVTTRMSSPSRICSMPTTGPLRPSVLMSMMPLPPRPW